MIQQDPIEHLNQIYQQEEYRKMEKTVDADTEFMIRACWAGMLMPERREMRMSKARTFSHSFKTHDLFHTIFMVNSSAYVLSKEKIQMFSTGL